MTDTTVSGFITPGVVIPEYDADLEDIFQTAVCGITDMPGKWVRPKWQLNPGNMPDQAQNWIAYGLTLQKRQWDAAKVHDPNGAGGLGTDTVAGTEVWNLTCSFYGPNCNLYESIFRDGLSLSQNRDTLAAKKIKFIEFMEPVTLPVLLKDAWNRRIDLKGVFHRWVERTYAIRTIASATSTLDNERYVTPLSVPNP